MALDRNDVWKIFYKNFLPAHLIYARKTDKNIPRFKFPEKVGLNAKPTHYSNSMEYIKLTYEDIAPFLEIEWQQLNLLETEKI